jgi:hypothetical protein
VIRKQLLISESRGDSNWCTPCRGKPYQHATCLPRLVYIWPSTIRISRGPGIAMFWESLADLDGSHCSWEKWLLTQSTARWLTDPRVHNQILSQVNQWNSRLKPSFCRCQAIRLTGSRSLACDRYVQYLLAGANPLVLNWHIWGLQPWRCWLSTHHSPTFPTSYLHFASKGPA